MEVEDLSISGLKRISLKKFEDPRGFFFESFRKEKSLEHGMGSFVQDNVSFSRKGVLRGLHFQQDPPQAKLVGCLQGEIWDVAIDLRKESPTYKKWVGVVLSEKNGQQLYLPEGFAHGFCVLSETALVHYKVSSYYSPRTEKVIRWDDPELSIHWPIKDPILSSKDSKSPYLSELFENG